MTCTSSILESFVLANPINDDLDFGLMQIYLQRLPLGQGIANGLAHRALREEVPHARNCWIAR